MLWLVHTPGCTHKAKTHKPNLVPPITTTAMALEYKSMLESLEPNVTFLMTLYLTPELTPAEIRRAHEAGIVGVKSYPRGVTTNSNDGVQVESYDVYYPVFEEMEKCGMVLNLHGECPSDAEKDITILNAEPAFLPILKKLHERFPRLRIVLEHATTKNAVEMVKSLGDTVGCTITLHHLSLVIDDWARDNHSYCKPVAKTYSDRAALRDIVKSGHPRFFLGSDSAPHPRSAKEGKASPAAGVFTSPYLMPLLAEVMEEIGALEHFESFASSNGRAFYGVTETKATTIKLSKVDSDTAIPDGYKIGSSNEVLVPWRAGSKLRWKAM